MAYTAGDDVKNKIKFEVDGDLTDPTAWSVHVQPPNEQAKFELAFGVDVELVKDADGEFTYTQPTSYSSGVDHGQWEYMVVSLGVAKGAKPGMFVVDEPTVAA